MTDIQERAAEAANAWIIEQLEGGYVPDAEEVYEIGWLAGYATGQQDSRTAGDRDENDSSRRRPGF